MTHAGEVNERGPIGNIGFSFFFVLKIETRNDDYRIDSRRENSNLQQSNAPNFQR